MASSEPTIDELRRAIDAIDDAMHDLLMKRATVVEEVGRAKQRAGDGAVPAIRPAREAAILRRLIHRHGGTFPAAVLVRMWREMLAGTTRMQGPFAIAVHAPEKSVGYWDLARDHYGSCTPMTLHRSARLVLREVTGGRAVIGVLAMPADGEPDPWWRHLVAEQPHVPRVVAALPFYDGGDGRFEKLRALAIARLPHEPSGDDATLLVLESDAELSRGRLREAFAKAELPATDIAAWTDPDAPANRLHLVEVATYLAAGDPRLATVQADLGRAAHRILGLGGYARPLVMPGARP